MKNMKKSLAGVLVAILLVIGYVTGVLPVDETIQGGDTSAATVTTTTTSSVQEEQTGPITEPQAIADYIFEHGELPDNFITKAEAQALGWDSDENYVGDVAPGMSIGGDRFGNYEGLLPKASGRQYYEADCYYEGKARNAHRIVYSNDGLVFYTSDHYESFTEMKPSK